MHMPEVVKAYLKLNLGMLLVLDALSLVGPTSLIVGFLLLQHFSCFVLSTNHHCFIYVIS